MPQQWNPTICAQMSYKKPARSTKLRRTQVNSSMHKSPNAEIVICFGIPRVQQSSPQYYREVRQGGTRTHLDVLEVLGEGLELIFRCHAVQRRRQGLSRLKSSFCFSTQSHVVVAMPLRCGCLPRCSVHSRKMPL